MVSSSICLVRLVCSTSCTGHAFARLDWVHAGSYADYTASKEEWLAKAPYGILLNILGGVPLVGLTAMQVDLAEAIFLASSRDLA